MYELGDSLGIYFENDLEFVDFFFNEFKWDVSESVMVNKEGEMCFFREVLIFNFEIIVLIKLFLK